MLTLCQLLLVGYWPWPILHSSFFKNSKVYTYLQTETVSHVNLQYNSNFESLLVSVNNSNNLLYYG